MQPSTIIGHGRLFALLVALASLFGALADGLPAAGQGGAAPPVHEPFATLDRLEDVRLLFAQTAYQIHELDTLLHYGRGFGLAAFDPLEAPVWHQRSLLLFELLKSLDDGGQGFAALADYQQHAQPLAVELAPLQALLGEAAHQTHAFHQALAARIADLRRQLAAATATAGLPPPQWRQPQPWAQPERELARRAGLTIAWPLWMTHRSDSRQAALDRQQQLDNQILLHKATKLGVNAILPEAGGQENQETVSWRVVESEPGRYDFSRLDTTIAQLAAHGLRIVVPVRSLSTLPPDWAADQLGPTARLWAHGADQPPPGDGINLFDPTTRERFAAYLHALAAHLATHHRQAVAAIALDVRAVALPKQLDYSPAGQAHFRQWLRQRYANDIGGLNAAWSTAHPSFATVDIPAPADEPPHVAGPGKPDGAPPAAAAVWHDWLNWRQDWVAEYFGFQAEILRQHLPETPLQAYALEANSHHAHSERPVASWPLLQMGRLADLPSSSATAEPIHALLRSVGQGRFFGLHAEQNFGSMLGGAAYTAFLKDALYIVARDGPEMILRYFYSDGLYGYMDRQIGWDGAYAYRLKTLEMHRLASTIENTRQATTPLAVLWSENSYDQDPTSHSRYGVLGTAFALMCAKFQYDMVLEQQVAAGILDRYQFLLVPEQRFLTDGTLDQLRAFVHRGGTLYATGIPGMFDERGRPRSEAGHQPLADVFGADLLAFTPIQAVLGTYLVPTRPDAVWDQRERGARWHQEWQRQQFFPEQWTLHGRLAASFTPRPGAEVLHRFADGSPAMVRHAFGDGQAVIFGYPFGHEFAFANTTEMSFGKLYPHFAYPVQMVNLHHWLGRFLVDTLGVPRPVEVPRSNLRRFVGSEASGPTMTYPSMSESYAAKRDHTASPNHSLNLGLRERDGLGTGYLTVFNRDSCYAYGRGFFHYMASPTYAIIRLNRTDLTAVYDLLNRSYVPLVAGNLSQRPDRQGRHPEADRCVSFQAVLPSYFGRVYALVTAAAPLELFEEGAQPQLSTAALAARVAALARPWEQPDVLVWEEEAIRAWLPNRQAVEPPRPVTISYGNLAYEAAAERLAQALRVRGLEVFASPLELQHHSPNPDPYYRHRGQFFQRPLPNIDIFVGNDHSNSNLADLSAAWQASRDANPRQRLSLNQCVPGGDRAILLLTSGFRVQRQRRFDQHFHAFQKHPRELVVGASSPTGALKAVDRLLELWPPLSEEAP